MEFSSPKWVLCVHWEIRVQEDNGIGGFKLRGFKSGGILVSRRFMLRDIRNPGDLSWEFQVPGVKVPSGDMGLQRLKNVKFISERK